MLILLPEYNAMSCPIANAASLSFGILWLMKIFISAIAQSPRQVAAGRQRQIAKSKIPAGIDRSRDGEQGAARRGSQNQSTRRFTCAPTPKVQFFAASGTRPVFNLIPGQVTSGSQLCVHSNCGACFGGPRSPHI
jgi:hypothetical protein